MTDFITQALLFLPPFLLAISFHESAHAYIAYRFGDPTARDMGRITLNPLPHIDILGLIMLMTVHFGWAKPVMINPFNLRNPRKDNLWISLAGPVSNLILAIISAAVFRILAPFLVTTNGGLFFLQMIMMSVTLNIVLMVFNLFPLPPLDGFHILEGLVSTDMYVKLQQVQQVGPMILFGLILLSYFTRINIFSTIFNPIVRVLGGFLLGASVGW
ncbi:MAG TPA: site-2 protease family protein [candidate division Zixibacteria bacterium]|nr:site-2 protease family protein [candidate division Zixibacteria bacterium]